MQYPLPPDPCSTALPASDQFCEHFLPKVKLIPSGVQCGAEIGQPRGLVCTDGAEGMPWESMCPLGLPCEAFLAAGHFSEPHFLHLETGVGGIEFNRLMRGKLEGGTCLWWWAGCAWERSSCECGHLRGMLENTCTHRGISKCGHLDSCPCSYVQPCGVHG